MLGRSCSVCGKSEKDKVLHLVEGDHGRVCNECIEKCVEVLKSKPR